MFIASYVVLCMSFVFGYKIWKGGKEMENENIEDAGLYWLFITVASAIILFIFIKMNNLD